MEQLLTSDELDSARATTLNTTDQDAARQIVEARNLALRQPALSREIGKACLVASDPAIRARTWQNALQALIDTKDGVTRHRWQRAAKEQPLDLIRENVIIETHAEPFMNWPGTWGQRNRTWPP